MTNHFDLNNRNNGIDLLRGISILAVITLHCFVHMPLTTNILSPSLTNIVFRSGFYGVIIFFVISGFLITSTSLRNWGSLQNISIGKFYQKRFARIMPCLLVVILILSGLHLLNIKGFVLKDVSLINAIFYTLTFQNNWLEAKTGYLIANWDVLWSLSVEEMFYLFFPIVCLTLRKNAYIILLMCLFILIGPFARTTFTDNEIWSDHGYLSCMGGIAIGCLAALFVYYVKISKTMLWSIILSGLSLFLLIFVFRKQTNLLGLSKLGLNVTLLEVSIGLILIAMQVGNAKRKNDFFKTYWIAPLRWFGRNSYEIYLTHSFLVIGFKELLFSPKQGSLMILIWYVCVLVLAGVLGELVAKHFSEPMNRFIRGKISNQELTKNYSIRDV